jgi:hypothetical protein
VFESLLKDFEDSSEKHTKIHVEIHGSEKASSRKFLEASIEFF